jgi:hypothetical protein
MHRQHVKKLSLGGFIREDVHVEDEDVDEDEKTRSTSKTILNSRKRKKTCLLLVKRRP